MGIVAVNFDDSIGRMGGAGDGISIPGMQVSSTSGIAIKAAAANGEVGMMRLKNALQLDGSLDASVVIHGARVPGGAARARARTSPFTTRTRPPTPACACSTRPWHPTPCPFP